ncbi:MAG: hypothetical protein U0793_12230 [Gemmataceae bacterium]
MAGAGAAGCASAGLLFFRDGRWSVRLGGAEARLLEERRGVDQLGEDRLDAARILDGRKIDRQRRALEVAQLQEEGDPFAKRGGQILGG